MANKIPPDIIISLIILVIFVIVVASIILPIFTGPEVTAQKTLAEEIDNACAAETGTVKQTTIYLPDSKGNTGLNLVFFYLAIDQDSLILARRTFGVETNDILVLFTEFIKNKPGNKILRETVLNNCLKDNVQICGQLDANNPSDLKCNSFQFESEEGKESLSFTITKTIVNNAQRVILSYARATVCGDGRCCEGETADNCPADCKDNKACKPFTQG